MNERKVPTQEELFEAIAVSRNLTTFSQVAPHGGVFIWVSTREKDPFKALMKAAATIVTMRGGAQAPDSPISITKLAIFAPGQQFYWQVQQDGRIVKDGYAATEEEAGREILRYMGDAL